MNKDTVYLAGWLLKRFPPLAEIPFTPETVAFVAQKIEGYRAAWEQHPLYEPCAVASTPVVLMYHHRPGVERREYSYIVVTLGDLGWSFRWEKHQNIGTFAGVMPIDEEFSVHPYRVTVYSFSYEGRARGFHARMELKRLLPPKLRKEVSKQRRAARGPKVWYLQRPLRVLDGKTYVEVCPDLQGASSDEIAIWMREVGEKNPPDWFKQMTKKQLWADWKAATEPAFYAQMNYWIDLADFYQAVTGQMNPNDIETCFKRLPKTAIDQPEQLLLF